MTRLWGLPVLHRLVEESPSPQAEREEGEVSLVSQQWFLRFVAHWRDKQEAMTHITTGNVWQRQKHKQTHAAGVFASDCASVCVQQVDPVLQCPQPMQGYFQVLGFASLPWSLWMLATAVERRHTMRSAIALTVLSNHSLAEITALAKSMRLLTID